MLSQLHFFRFAACTALFCFLASSTAAPIPKQIRKKSDPLEALQGRWEIVTLDTTGTPSVQTGDFGTFYAVVEGNTFSTGTKGGPGFDKVKFSLDTEASPMVMTFINTGNKNIFEVDGDTFKWSESNKTTPPDSFVGGNGKNSFVFKRSTK
jgi:uncharacterized protein (TIGR03067 family)